MDKSVKMPVSVSKGSIIPGLAMFSYLFAWHVWHWWMNWRIYLLSSFQYNMARTRWVVAYVLEWPPAAEAWSNSKSSVCNSLSRPITNFPFLHTRWSFHKNEGDLEPSWVCRRCHEWSTSSNQLAQIRANRAGSMKDTMIEFTETSGRRRRDTNLRSLMRHVCWSRVVIHCSSTYFKLCWSVQSQWSIKY